MKIRLLIATVDMDYANHLSGYLSEKYADIFEVTATSQQESFNDLFIKSRFDGALVDNVFAKDTMLDIVRLPLLLLGDGEMMVNSEFVAIQKYQRISSMVGNILEAFAERGMELGNIGKNGGITAVWSPAGGGLVKQQLPLPMRQTRPQQERKLPTLTWRVLQVHQCILNKTAKASAKHLKN